jgi:hypothetical protein
MPARPAGPRTGLRRPFPPRREIERYGREIRLFMPPLFASVEAQLRRMTTLLRRSNPRVSADEAARRRFFGDDGPA